jgi:hypothetical protein
LHPQSVLPIPSLDLSNAMPCFDISTPTIFATPQHVTARQTQLTTSKITVSKDRPETLMKANVLSMPYLRLVVKRKV